MYKTLLVFGFLLASVSQAAPCALHQTLDASDRLAPDFIVRSGYSRDNDDAAEGHYETAVFDFELVGHKQADGSGVCVYLVSTATLTQHQAQASSYAASWYLRKAGSYQVASGGWKVLEKASATAVATRVQRRPVASYMDGRMGTEYVRTSDNGPSVELRNELFLGKFPDGQYAGRVYFQAPSGRGASGPVFNNVDDRNYDIVRHVGEWRLDLDNGTPVGPATLGAVKNPSDPSKKVAVYGNQVRLVPPAWSGTPVVIREVPRQTEIKYHSVGLLWADVLLLGTNDYGARRFFRYKQLDLMRSGLPEGVTSADRFGRYKAKSIHYATTPVAPAPAAEVARPLDNPGRERRRR